MEVEIKLRAVLGCQKMHEEKPEKVLMAMPRETAMERNVVCL